MGALSWVGLFRKTMVIRDTLTFDFYPGVSHVHLERSLSVLCVWHPGLLYVAHVSLDCWLAGTCGLEHPPLAISMCQCTVAHHLNFSYTPTNRMTSLCFVICWIPAGSEAVWFATRWWEGWWQEERWRESVPLGWCMTCSQHVFSFPSLSVCLSSSPFLTG